MIYKLNLRLILIASWVLALLIPFFLLVFGSQSYYFNVYALGNLLASYFIGILGIAIAGKKLAQKERFYLFALSLSLFLWHWAHGIGYLCRPSKPTLAIDWFKAANVGVIFIAAHVYAFTINFLKLKRTKTIVVGYAIAGFFVVLSSLTNFFIVGIYQYYWGFYPKWQFFNTIPYFLYFSTYLSLSLLEYFKAWRRSNSQHVKSQISYLVFAFSTSYAGSVDYMPALGHSVYPCGYIAVMGWWSILAYAILKHRLMDINVIIRKTLIYSTVMGTLTVMYLGVVGLFAHLFEGFTGAQTVFSSAVAAGLITLCFQPLRKKVQGFVDAKFFRQYVDREEKLYELSREVITHTTPEAMEAALRRVLDEALHPKAVGLYLRARDGNGFERVSSSDSSALPLRMEEDNGLASYFKDHPQPFVQDLTSDVGQSFSTRLKEDRESAA